jgi:hypothetical protein
VVELSGRAEERVWGDLGNVNSLWLLTAARCSSSVTGSDLHGI